MKILVVGLGSMGKRRVRNLQALGYKDIAGFDLRLDRRIEADDKYGIAVFEEFSFALSTFKPNALVISTSPRWHMDYAWTGLECGIPCFIEASVVEAERILQLYHKSREASVVMAPSCTMRYFPGPKKVKEIVRSNVIGRPLNVNYQTGQYLPDWHPWERIEDYYVSQRETGGGREIVPFELTWLNDVFGTPTPLAAVKAKVTEMSADIDDIYHCLLRYSSGALANITVEVVSRPHATRELRVLGSKGEVVYSGDENCVRYSNIESPSEWTRYDLGGGTVEAGYINPEEPYIAEMNDFMRAVTAGDQELFPNNLLDDYNTLKVLYQLEKLSMEVK